MQPQDKTIPNIQQSVSRDFKGIWIPREIWLHEELLPLEKMVWAEIHSLYDRTRGGCYASNNYLAQFFGVGETYISKLIAKLKNLGLVEDVTFNGRTRIIRAILPPEDLGECKADLHCSARQTNTTVQGRHAPQCNPPPYIENKEDNKDKNVYAPPKGDAKKKPSSSSKTQKTSYKSSDLVEMASHHPEAQKFMQVFKQPLVGISDDHHKELIEKYGEETTKKFYIHLADWKASKAQASPKDVTKHSDYYRIKKWVIKEVLENPNQSPAAYKRTGKLAIEADKAAMEELKKNGTSYVSMEQLSKKILEENPTLVEDYMRKREALRMKDLEQKKNA